MATSEILAVTLEVAAVFESMGLDYLVGGSLASSFHGIPRSTYDVDMLVSLTRRHVGQLVSQMQDDFYIDEGMITEAIKNQSSFNIIHLKSMLKIDIFVLSHDTLTQNEMSRRQRYPLPGESGRHLVVASAEDIILQKLKWYVLGNKTSDRQWHDVLGVLKVQKETIDYEYLQETAKGAGLGDVLSEALTQARV